MRRAKINKSVKTVGLVYGIEELEIELQCFWQVQTILLLTKLLPFGRGASHLMYTEIMQIIKRRKAALLCFASPLFF